jgi:hypothetical protein
MFEVAIIGFVVGSVTGACYSAGAVLALMLAALLGAILHAAAGFFLESTLMLGLFAITLQSSYVMGATIRTLLRRMPRMTGPSAASEEADELFDVSQSCRRISRIAAKS